MRGMIDSFFNITARWMNASGGPCCLYKKTARMANQVSISKVRIDKWLWSIRIFKSRTLATDACKGGKVKVKGETVKPSFLLAEGNVAAVKKDGFTFEFKAIQLIEKRVGAAIAVACYEDVTPAEERDKYNAWFLNATPTTEQRDRGVGRPTKKDRRELDDLKDAEVYDWEDVE